MSTPTLTAIEPPPSATPVINKDGTMQKNWLDWLLLKLIPRLTAVGVIKRVVPLTGQSAAIPATSLVQVTGAGVYRISRYVQISTIDGVASAVQLTVTYTYLGQTLTIVGANVNGDTLTSRDEGVDTIRTDGGTSITYAFSYASTTPNKMQFSGTVIAEAIS